MAAGNILAAGKNIVEESYIDDRNFRLMYAYALEVESLRLSDPKFVRDFLISGRFSTEVGSALQDFRRAFCMAISDGTIGTEKISEVITNYVDKGPRIFKHYE